MTSVGHQLLDAPIDKMIGAMANAIADAQVKLDRTSIEMAQFMSGVRESDRVAFGSRNLSLMELGLTPTFYQFTHTLIEVKMSITLTKTRSDEGDSSEKQNQMGLHVGSDSWRYETRGSSVNASYANKYAYNVEGSSLLRTRITPVPAPGIFEERVRALMELDAAFRREQPDAVINDV